MKKIMIYIGSIILPLFIVPITFADFQNGISECGFGNYGMMGYGNYGIGFGYIFVLIFLLVIIALTVFIFKNINSNKNIGNSYTSSDILKKRLANGEITEKEFDSLMNKINENNK